MHILYFLFFLLQLSSSLETNSQELTTLQALKQQWRNPTSLASWSELTPVCTGWIGITCTNGSVTQLILPNMNITEKIPPSICDLPYLTHIDLSFNYLPGEFPLFLYNCTQLYSLDLSQNYFVGSLPLDIHRLSSNLHHLNLSSNNFSGDIPPSIGELHSLRTLKLVYNLFNGSFPTSIGGLYNLETLGLAHNEFRPSRIPSEFSQLKNLQFLWMSEANLIGGIPDTFGSLANLEHFDLSMNDLSGKIPASLFMLKNLSYMYLYANRLSGEIPRVVQTLHLREIDLSINNLTGTIPEGFGELQYLESFDMYANRLSGEIPESIGLIPSLTRMRLFKNNLTGSLPPELGLHSKLHTIEVSENSLTGNLPEHLCAGGALIGVVAFSNYLSGELPKSLTVCQSLMSIQLYRNSLTGEIPEGFWSMGNLSSIMISENSFSGELPDELAWNLTRLEIHNNRFSGKIPARINSSRHLTVFHASNNVFSGEIPVELTALSRLQTLSLDQNRLSGQIPVNIISWKSLTNLNLSMNQLSGDIPPVIGLLPDLLQLDLSENRLSGHIPPGIGHMRLTFLNLSSNHLTGNIPAELKSSAFDKSFLNNPGLIADVNASKFQSTPRKLSSPLLLVLLALAGVLAMAFLLYSVFVIERKRSQKMHAEDLSAWKLTSFQKLHFTESEIVGSLTANNLIGSGGSGKVYRVPLEDAEPIAVKQIWNTGKLDELLEKEFQAEVEILGTIRHSNIVKLFCCITRENSMLLVYEYMQNSSLDKWLHGKRAGSENHLLFLDWPARLHIAVGAAKGLCYMHHGCPVPIIHRDVKSSNVLLDANFNARIADFGLARMLVKHGESDTMSAVAGSYGYIAPEYAYTTKVNEKIDVYSFGVVLLELATGKEPNDGDEHSSLAEWSWRHFQDGKPLTGVLDQKIMIPAFLDEIKTVFKLGLICTGTLPSTRPSMNEVLQVLLQCNPRLPNEEKVQYDADAQPLLYATERYLLGYDSSQSKRSLKSDEDGNDTDGTHCS